MTKSQRVESSSDNGNDVDFCGHVATLRETKPIPQNLIGAPTVLVSCGVTNFEDSNYATGASNEFRNWIGDYKVEHGILNEYPETKDTSKGRSKRTTQIFAMFGT